MQVAQKEKLVGDFNSKFASLPAAFVVNYQGCTCKDITAMRHKLREKHAEFMVVKNTLAKRSLAGTKSADLVQFLKGPSAVIWIKQDPVEPAKIITEFAKEKEKFVVKGGIVDGQVVSVKDLEALAKMPSKVELQAKLLGLLNAPAVQLLGMLKAPAGSLARLLGAWKGELEKKQ